VSRSALRIARALAVFALSCCAVSALHAQPRARELDPGAAAPPFSSDASAAAGTLVFASADAGSMDAGIATGAPLDSADAATATSARTAPAEVDGASIASPSVPAPVSLAAPSPAFVEATPVEVTVRSTRNEAQRLQRSADAVVVVDLRRAKEQTGDLGEVLARTQGVAIRRDSGLGSTTRFSLNGLYDHQIRLFLDGVPLELAGYPFGIGNVPINIVERAEIYRGVVPIRLGADALGGAVNLVTNHTYENRLSVSYQLGSFGTHRAHVDGLYRHEPSGFIVGGHAFFDRAKNDYDVTASLTDETGMQRNVRVPRFHDGYTASGVTLEVGVVDRPWAKRLLLQSTFATYDKELQHDPMMKVPYGEVTYGETAYAATARYEVKPHTDVELELLANYSRRTIDFKDVGEWVYNWAGERGRQRRVPGERDLASDRTTLEHVGFGRALVSWNMVPGHTLRASLTPQYTTRTGNERVPSTSGARDPLMAVRDLFTLVSGLEYQVNLLDERVENVLFVKNYVYRLKNEDPQDDGSFLRREADRHRAGVGDSLKVRILPWLSAKASYEYATRLPRPEELFGDGRQTVANLELKPEVSHNANIGPRVELKLRSLGELTLDVNGFLRDSNRLIAYLGSERSFVYENVQRARARGVENGVTWRSPGRWVDLHGALTWLDTRNHGRAGTFGAFHGDRIPNRPYFFGSWGARANIPGLLGSGVGVAPFYHGRYVHEFFRSWESAGMRDGKDVIPKQVAHSLGLTLTFQGGFGKLLATIEADNLSDALLFDNFGVQRPGRAFYAKLMGSL